MTCKLLFNGVKYLENNDEYTIPAIEVLKICDLSFPIVGKPYIRLRPEIKEWFEENNVTYNINAQIIGEMDIVFDNFSVLMAFKLAFL